MEQAGNAKASPADQQSNETLHITNKLPTNQLIMGAEDRSQPRYNSLRNRGFRITQGGTSQQPSSCSRLQQSFELRTASSSSNGLKNPLNNIFWIYKIPLPSFFFPFVCWHLILWPSLHFRLHEPGKIFLHPWNFPAC